jgi:hypothetical protein
MLPNSWLRYWSDAKFDFRRRSFREANFDIDFPLGDKGKFSAGYRYYAPQEDSAEEGSKLFTVAFERLLNPKWKFRSYHRLEFTAADIIEEQEYTLSRDLHCWEIDFTVNSKKKKGVTFWLEFRCKSFPDLGFDVSASSQQPKTKP